jgi:hypothetical protein
MSRKKNELKTMVETIDASQLRRQYDALIVQNLTQNTEDIRDINKTIGKIFDRIDKMFEKVITWDTKCITCNNEIQTDMKEIMDIVKPIQEEQEKEMKEKAKQEKKTKWEKFIDLIKKLRDPVWLAWAAMALFMLVSRWTSDTSTANQISRLKNDIDSIRTNTPEQDKEAMESFISNSNNNLGNFLFYWPE